MGIWTRSALVVTLLASTLAACTPAADSPVPTSAGQSTSDVINERLTGLPLPLWVGTLRRGEIKREGSVHNVSYGNGVVTVLLYTMDRAVPDGTAGENLRMEFVRGAAGIYEWAESRRGARMVEAPNLPKPTTTPGSCTIGGVEWLCGGFQLVRPETRTLVALYVRGYKGRPVLVNTRSGPGQEGEARAFMEFLSREMTQRR
jgi:hypothetical protein